MKIDRKVRSRTNPNVEYHVIVGDDGSKSCTCKGFEHRRTCFHVEEALKELFT